MVKYFVCYFYHSKLGAFEGSFEFTVFIYALLSIEAESMISTSIRILYWWDCALEVHMIPTSALQYSITVVHLHCAILCIWTIVLRRSDANSLSWNFYGSWLLYFHWSGLCARNSGSADSLFPVPCEQCLARQSTLLCLK